MIPSISRRCTSTVRQSSRHKIIITLDSRRNITTTKNLNPNHNFLRKGLFNQNHAIQLLSQSQSQLHRHRPLSSVSYAIQDLFKHGSFNPPNPITEFSNKSSGSNDSSPFESLIPLLSKIEPRHFESSIKTLHREYVQNMAEYQATLQALKEEEEEEERDGKTSNDNDYVVKVDYEDLMSNLERISSPLQTFKQILSICASTGFYEDELKDIYNKVFQNGEYNFSTSENNNDVILNTLQKLQTQLNDDIQKDPGNKPLTERKRAVDTLLLDKENDNCALLSKEESNSLEEFELNFSQFAPHKLSLQDTISQFYGILSLKQKKAQASSTGDNFAEYIFNKEKDLKRLSSIDEMTQIHQIVNERAKPIACDIMEGKITRSDAAAGLNHGHLHFERVLKGMLDLSSDLFGIRIVKREKEDIVDSRNGVVWHEDVRLYEVYDTMNNGELLGSFLYDPHVRPNKEKGAWFMPLIQRNSKQGIKPVCFIGTNMDPPAWSDEENPIVITFADAKNLFHEFGHVLEFLLSTNVEYGSLSGASYLEKDACEFVSQFMEHWLYDGNVLQSYILPSPEENNGFGEYPIPEVVKHLKTERQHEYALRFSAQTLLGQMELDLFGGKFDQNIMSIIAFQRKYCEMYTPFDIPQKTDLSKLRTIFEANANGEVLTFYRYLYSNIMSVDAFFAFNGDDDDLKKVGKHFRQTILEPGASISSSDKFRNFRGKDPELKFLLEYYGLESDNNEEKKEEEDKENK